MNIKETAIDELAHHLLNGIEVIESLCLQGRKGILTQEEAFAKIEHRAKGMEQAFTAIRDCHRLRQTDTDKH